MTEPAVVHSTFVLERNYPKPPARVFDAFADIAKKRRWYGESKSHDLETFTMDFRPGGAEHARYRFRPGSPFPGAVLSNDGSFLDIVPERRIVIASTMAMDGRRFSASLLTIELRPAAAGTDLICTHQGAFFEGSDGPQMREAGWRLLFDQLGKELAP